jgi:hypothetical protein
MISPYQKEVFDFDSFEMSPNLVLFNFQNIAPSSCFLQIRQSPRRNTPSPIHNQSPRHKASSPKHGHLSQLNWIPFVDISAKDFEMLVGNIGGSKRKLPEESLPDNKHSKPLDKLLLHSLNSINTNSKSKTKTATKKRSKI